MLMSMISRILNRWFGRSHTSTRLSQEQAVQIARQAAAGQLNCELLGLATVEEQNGKRIWAVSSATIGSSLLVRIDDESGDVLEVKRQGVR
jgi:acetylglutamate kinase